MIQDTLIYNETEVIPFYHIPIEESRAELVNFCKEYFPNLIENDNSILTNSVIDILIPEVGIGIMYAGLYTHSELKGRDSKYFSAVTLEAKLKNIRLLHVYEDEWLNKRDIVESILLARMDRVKYKIYARKCELGNVPKELAKQFINDNHIQKSSPGSHYGLYFKDELVSLVSMGKSRFNKNIEWEIIRFCSKKHCQVVGGFSRIFSYFVEQMNPNTVMTYADARYGEGKVYETCGFTPTHKADSNYFYVVNGVRESRQKFQKHKLEKQLKTFDPNLTEWQNMTKNGYDRIWDCGNYVFLWTKQLTDEEAVK